MCCAVADDEQFAGASDEFLARLLATPAIGSINLQGCSMPKPCWAVLATSWAAPDRARRDRAQAVANPSLLFAGSILRFTSFGRGRPQPLTSTSESLTSVGHPLISIGQTPSLLSASRFWSRPGSARPDCLGACGHRVGPCQAVLGRVGHCLSCVGPAPEDILRVTSFGRGNPLTSTSQSLTSTGQTLASVGHPLLAVGQTHSLLSVSRFWSRQGRARPGRTV